MLKGLLVYNNIICILCSAHRYDLSSTFTPPQDECSYDNTESVCGVNGETYDSRCHAENAYVAVDYSGRCTDVPGTNVLQTNIRGNCADVVCPQLPPDCVGVLSHDSCCPQCGSHLTILSDKELLKRNIDALGREFLSSADMLRKLRYHISSVRTCMMSLRI